MILWPYLQLTMLKFHQLKLGNISVSCTAVLTHFHFKRCSLKDELQGWEEEERIPHYGIRQGFPILRNLPGRLWLCSRCRGGQSCQGFGASVSALLTESLQGRCIGSLPQALPPCEGLWIRQLNKVCFLVFILCCARRYYENISFK